MTTAFLFPGQGSHVPGMLHELPDHPLVLETFEEANEMLSESVTILGSEVYLKSTVAVQICLLVAGVAAARVLMDDKAEPDFVAGHSVGAFGAGVISGALEFKDAVRVVKTRGEKMESIYPNGFGMGVIMGLRETELNHLIQENSTEENPIYIANINSPQQITISGSVPDLQRFLKISLDHYAQRAELLNVHVPSHCPLMNNVSKALEDELSHIPFNNPRIPYIGNRRARAIKKGEGIKQDLAWNVSHSVRWHESTSLLYELGVRLFVEMPPSQVLTDLAHCQFPSARSLSLSNHGWKSASILVQR